METREGIAGQKIGGKKSNVGPWIAQQNQWGW
jgi:hypothetical protein